MTNTMLFVVVISHAALAVKNIFRQFKCTPDLPCFCMTSAVYPHTRHDHLLKRWQSRLNCICTHIDTCFFVHVLFTCVPFLVSTLVIRGIITPRELMRVESFLFVLQFFSICRLLILNL